MALIGILGGMGPLATVDFMDRVVRLTSMAGAACDQQHLPMLVADLPHIPDRSKAILEAGEDPLPALLEGIDMLNRNGVELIAIPCNRSEEHTSELQSHVNLVCRLLLETNNN